MTRFILLFLGLLCTAPLAVAQSEHTPAPETTTAPQVTNTSERPSAEDQILLAELQQRASRANAAFAAVRDPILRQRVGTLIEYYQAALAQTDLNRMDNLLRQIERALKIPATRPPKKAQADGKDPFSRFYGRNAGYSFGMVNTNFDNNKKEISGGMDADIRHQLVETRADADFYPNMVTDRMMVRRDSPVWQQLGLAFNQIVGHGATITPIIPNPGFEAGLVRDGNTINLIANQLFRAAKAPETPKRSLLVTWILPPNWQPDQQHALLMIFPPMGQSNNMALFDDPALKNWAVLMEALKASTSDRLALMLVNSGGLTASGIQPDLEYPLLEAVRFGVNALGIDPARIAMMGVGRGGYAAMAMAGRMMQIAPPEAGIALRGLFIGEAGTLHEELSISPTLAPFDLVNRRIEQQDQTIARLIGVSGLEDLRKHSPDQALAMLKPTLPMVFFWHGNVWNQALLPASISQLMGIVNKIPNTQSQFLIDHSETLNRHEDTRYRLAVDCLVRLSEHQNCALPETGLIHADSNGFTTPLLVRGPSFALAHQPVSLEIMGAGGTPVTIAVTSSTKIKRVLRDQIIPDHGVLRLNLPANSGDGRMQIELLNPPPANPRTAIISVPVFSTLPDLSLPDGRAAALAPAIMPHIVQE